MKRIQRGPVRGISLKLQEEERERRMDFVPEVSAIRTTSISVDPTTSELLAELGLKDLPNVNVNTGKRGNRDARGQRTVRNNNRRN